MTVSRYLLIAGLACSPGLALAQTATLSDVVKEVHGVHNDVVYQNGLTGAKLDKIHDDLAALLKALQAAPVAVSTGTTTATTPAAGTTSPVSYPGDVVTAFDPCAGMTGKWSTLKIAPSVSMSNAMVCAAPSFTLLLEPGTYNQVVHIPGTLSPASAPASVGGDVANGGTADTVHVSGRGGCTVAQNNAGGCATKLAYGKGVFHSDGPVAYHDMEVRDGGSNAAGDHDGQAGIYYEGGSGGTARVTHVMLRNNENGIFANTNATYDFVFTEDDFVGNGTDGGSHSSYISGGASLTLNGIHDYGSNLGNNQKSRVPVVTATNVWSKSIQGRWIEAADGATVAVTGGTFIGNGCCQNVFGNGTESTSKGPGNTTWSNSVFWFGRAENFANAGTFTGSGLSVTCASGAYAANDHGGDLTGLPTCPANSNASAPADAPFISGAKS